MGNSPCIFWEGHRKALLSRYLEAILGRKMYLLSCQCWNWWIWDLRLLLRSWTCNSTNLLPVYAMKIKALHHWASQGFTNWPEFTETSTSKPSSSEARTRKYKGHNQEPSWTEHICSRKKISRSAEHAAWWCCCKKVHQTRRLKFFGVSQKNFQNRNKAHPAQETPT